MPATTQPLIEPPARLSESATPSPASPSPEAERPEKRQTGVAAWLLAPTLILLALVIGYPVVSAVVMSLQKDAGLANGFFVQGGFAGFANYTAWLLQQCPSPTGDGTQACAPGQLGSQFWSSMGNTFFFTIVTVAFETVIGFWMATIMAKNFRGRGLLRAAVLVPWAIPTAVTAKLFYFMFDYNGVINKALGLHVLWYGSEWPAKWAIIIADVEDHSVHGAADPGRPTNHPLRGL